MEESNLKNLEDKLKEKINLLNNYKIFSNNDNILCIEENTQHYKNLKKKFPNLKKYSGPLFLEKTSDFVLFTNHGDVIILLDNNEIYTTLNDGGHFGIRTRRVESFFYEENPLFGKKKYIFSVDEDKSVYVTKESFDILKSLLPVFQKNAHKKNNVLFELKEEKRLAELNLKNEQKRLIKEERREELKLKNEEKLLRKEERLKKLKVSQTKILNELDKDGNGIVDVVEGDDFEKLLKKDQKKIIDIDRKYIKQFVEVSFYLKTKKENIQLIFNSLTHTTNKKNLNEYVEILKDEIHNYNIILLNSLNMIVSFGEDDITFWKIYHVFDKLNMFDSQHEKDISKKLTNLGVGLENISKKLIIIENRLKDVMYEVRNVGEQITNSIQELTWMTEDSKNSNEELSNQLSNQLSGIDSTLKVGNLISVINTYQNYKTNKRLKNLK